MSDTTPNIRETTKVPGRGGPKLILFLFMMLVSLAGLILGANLVDGRGGTAVIGGLLIPLSLLTGLVNFVCLFGLIVVEPNESKVLLWFGDYAGTVKHAGWYWVNPFYSKNKVSLRIVNFETERLKVNDLDGNPIEIGAIVVWKVVDTAEASFAVEDYENYVHVQSEAALRNLATQYPYDAHEDDVIALRSHTLHIAEKLKEEIHDRLQQAGVEVIEARISHLAYAPEIAQAMLQRQQAGAIIAARQKIVEGAVGMVEMALDSLSEKEVVELDGDQRAAMVSNLLVVLCGETAASPVVNTGTIH
ncbi:MAG: SPFH domain-containing protein [Planctomycetota bacterium]|jgi:regulator of protease activity HflC (stomatin/prohibitin superfamily)